MVDTIVLGFTGEISLGNLRLIRRYTRNFEVSKKNPLYCSLNGLVYSKNGSKLLSCPQWKTGIMVIGKGVESIYDNAFCMCKISSVKFSDTVTNIGSMSFYNCDFLNLGITKTNDLRTLLSTVSIEENPVAKAYILQTIKNKKLHNVNDVFII